MAPLCQSRRRSGCLVVQPDFGEVDLDSFRSLGDGVGLVGRQPGGAGVVDEERLTVRGAPEEAPGAGDAGGVTTEGLGAVVSSAQGTGVVGSGLTGWTTSPTPGVL